ncbi:unnamed protein product [Absidia cylindrospora]
MEYCPGGGVIDLMNRRLQQRLTEPEILNIFSNVCEALAYMHYCQPPVLHRDLKVENILILSQDQYKLCDFGSAALSKGSYIPSTLQEIQKVEDDVQRHTTLQYRAPEMIDIYQKKPINEKADIWALGVLLYKLCYYTTPFEEQGQLAILNAHYSIPQTPYFSNGLRQLIISMLQEDQQKRPNIYQVVKSVSGLLNVECPIRNIYQDKRSSPPSHFETPTMNHSNDSPSSIFEKLPSSPSQLPDITPMRRGRPIRQKKDISGTPTPSLPISAPQSQIPTATSGRTTPSAFDPFDPSQVKVHGDQDFDYAQSTRSSSSATPNNGFDNEDFSTTFSNDDDVSSDNTTYPWQLESQTLDPISIPPEKSQQRQQDYHQRQHTPSSSPGMVSSSLQQSNASDSTFISGTGATIPSTKSTKSIRDFMERKRAPYSSPSSSPKTASSPLPENTTSPSSSSASVKATVEQMESSSGSNISSPAAVESSSSSVKATIEQMESSSSRNTAASSYQAQTKDGPQRPKPPPKPARFRTKPSSTSTTTTTDNNTGSSGMTSSQSPRPPSISDFEDKFPSVEQLYTSLPSR